MKQTLTCKTGSEDQQNSSSAVDMAIAILAYGCVDTVRTDLRDTAVLQFLANSADIYEIYRSIFTEAHSFNDVHYLTAGTAGTT